MITEGPEGGLEQAITGFPYVSEAEAAPMPALELAARIQQYVALHGPDGSRRDLLVSRDLQDRYARTLERTIEGFLWVVRREPDRIGFEIAADGGKRTRKMVRAVAEAFEAGARGPELAVAMASSVRANRIRLNATDLAQITAYFDIERALQVDSYGGLIPPEPIRAVAR